MLALRVTADEAETAHHPARMGYGLIQASRYRLREDLARGALVEVLPDQPLPLAAYYPQTTSCRRACGFSSMGSRRFLMRQICRSMYVKQTRS